LSLRWSLSSVKQYKKLYDYYLHTSDKEYKAWFETASLQIKTGAREGYGSLKNKIMRLKARNIIDISSAHTIDLDDEIIETSLIGLKWDNMFH
jgi:hypothetical protein